MRFAQGFTKNKEVVRALQRETIEACLKARLGQLRYFGLTSSSLHDAIAWRDLFESFHTVERGEEGKEWELQHDLELRAYRAGLSERVLLLRGDIDQVIRRGKDQFGNKATFPFDVVSLDYSGGLFYKDRKNNFTRLQAIASLIERQAKGQTDFVFLISCNLDAVDSGEVRRTLENVRTDLVRYGVGGERLVEGYLNHSQEEARLKIYVPYFLNQEAARNHYHCETQPVVMYEGNLKTRMMAFRFYLQHDSRTQSLRSPRERLSQLFNRPILQIVDGELQTTLLGLDTLKLPEEPTARE